MNLSYQLNMYQPNNMDQTNKTEDIHPISDLDRFYILMGPLHDVVDPANSVQLNEYKTTDEVRQAITDRANRVKAALKRPAQIDSTVKP